MVESKERIFLCNRWFYLVDETDECFFYSTNINSKKSVNFSIKLELNKKTNEMKLIYFNKNKAIGIINISSIRDYPITFHYSQLVPEEMQINQNTYFNLLIELIGSMDDRYSISKDYKILFHKSKKMSKLCYREPDFPLETELNINDIDINTRFLNQFIDLVSLFGHTLAYINEHLLGSNKSEEAALEMAESISNQEIKNLEIPQELMVYDRMYHFVEAKDSLYIYTNDEDGKYNLIVKVDHNDLKIDAIRFQIDKGTNKRGLIEIKRESQNELVTNLSQRGIPELHINQKIIVNATIRSLIVYNDLGAELSHEVDIYSNQKNYHLEKHPYLSTFLLDEEGNFYDIINSQYKELSFICSSSANIFHNIERKIIKKKIV